MNSLECPFPLFVKLFDTYQNTKNNYVLNVMFCGTPCIWRLESCGHTCAASDSSDLAPIIRFFLKNCNSEGVLEASGAGRAGGG